MLNMPAEFEQFHWMVDMVQNVDMGLVVIDRDYNVQVWNGFMTHHSGLQSHDAIVVLYLISSLKSHRSGLN